MKHSPGPWAIHGSTVEPLFYVHAANKVCIIPKPSGYTQSPAEREANARLIAAAPNLLEAVKLLQAALTQYRLRDVKKRYSLCVADAIASTAIAKAEGR